MKTTDLVDKYEDELLLVDAIGLKHFGKIREFHGEIWTVKCHEDNSLVRQAIEQPGEGRVLIVDGGGSSRYALLGDINAAVAIKNNWLGFIIYGAVRDSEELSKLNLGVMALETCPRKTIKRNEGTAGIPVKFGGVEFRPKEYVYADHDGVLVSKKLLSIEK